MTCQTVKCLKLFLLSNITVVIAPNLSSFYVAYIVCVFKFQIIELDVNYEVQRKILLELEILYKVRLRGMIKNNVDFCYKKLYSQHRLIQTIPFSFGNCLGSENKIFVLILFITLVHGLFLLPWLRAPGAVQ